MNPSKCGWLRHDWGTEHTFFSPNTLTFEAIWFRGVPDIWVPSAEGGAGRPDEKVCGRCGKRKPLRWSR